MRPRRAVEAACTRGETIRREEIASKTLPSTQPRGPRPLGGLSAVQLEVLMDESENAVLSTEVADSEGQAGPLSSRSLSSCKLLRLVYNEERPRFRHVVLQ
mmetsp:Transcript_41050/g.131984  ORF Transcript_41050/g.131984 Transcript_41050/m.131984 type:complete len:101 (-) Transcript_41050:286-588(-)